MPKLRENNKKDRAYENIKHYGGKTRYKKNCQDNQNYDTELNRRRLTKQKRG